MLTIYITVIKNFPLPGCCCCYLWTLDCHCLRNMMACHAHR